MRSGGLSWSPHPVDNLLVTSSSITCWAAPWVTPIMQSKSDPELQEAKSSSPEDTRGGHPGTSQWYGVDGVRLGWRLHSFHENFPHPHLAGSVLGKPH